MRGFALAWMVAAGVAAQSSSESSTSTSSSTATATSSSNVTTHTVTVGEGGYNKFVPNVTVAKAGDIIQFFFYPLNHSLVKAEEGYPCIPYDTMNPGKASFFSGFEYVPQVLSNPPSYNLTVNDTSPVYFYCSAPGSCKNYGMVGVINPENATSIDVQAAKALEAGSIMLQPGEGFPSEDTTSSLALIATATLTTTVAVPSATNGSTLATSTTTATATAAASEAHHLSGGAIAGIVIAGVAVLALAGALLWYMSRSRTLRQTLEQQRGAQASENQHTPTGPFDEGKFDGSRWSTTTTGMLPPYAGSLAPTRDGTVSPPPPDGYYAHELASKEGAEGPQMGFRAGPVASELEGGGVHEMD